MKWIIAQLALMVLSSNAMGSAHEIGGISGGGGNVIVSKAPQVTAPVESVENILEHLKPNVADYLVQKESDFHRGLLDQESADTFAPLFQTTTNVSDRVERIKVSIEDDGPCFDSTGTAYDGSSSVQKRGAICMSAVRIAGRVESSEIEAQSSALMVHEFSEVLGLSDEQALAIQVKVLEELQTKSDQ